MIIIMYICVFILHITNMYVDVICKFSDLIYFVSFILTGNIESAILTVYFLHQFSHKESYDLIFAAFINTIHIAYTIYATISLWIANNVSNASNAASIAIMVIYLCLFTIIRIVYFARIFKSYINIG